MHKLNNTGKGKALTLMHNHLSMLRQETTRAAFYAKKDLQMIKEHLLAKDEEFKLTELQEQRLTELEFAYNQIVSGKYSEYEVVTLIRNRNKGMSRPTAKRILDDSKDLFGSFLSIKKQWEYRRQLEINQQIMQKAAEAEDFKAYSILEKNRIKLIEMIEEIDQTNRMFEGHAVIVSADPTLIGIEAPSISEKKELFDRLRAKYEFDIEDAEEILPEDE